MISVVLRKIEYDMRPLGGKVQKGADDLRGEQEDRGFLWHFLGYDDLHENDQDNGIQYIYHACQNGAKRAERFKTLRPFFQAERHQFRKQQRHNDVHSRFYTFGVVVARLHKQQ